MVEDRDPVRDAHDEVHVVAHQENRRPAEADPPDEVGQRIDLGLREPRRRLVEEEDGRAPCERPRGLDQALVPEPG